jgi:hypothetical protein
MSMSSAHFAVPAVKITPDLLDRAAAAVCRLPENADAIARNRAILEVLIDEGRTAHILETCRAVDARLDALCRLCASPLLAAWVRTGDGPVGYEVLVAAAETPLEPCGTGYRFPEGEFFTRVLDAAAVRGAA